MKNLININKTYNKVKNVFVAPETSWYFGRWRNCPGLPVWRTGNWIKWRGKSYRLPIWLSFGIWNLDVMYKTKWTPYDFRYEFPPQFSIVAFGLCFVVLKGWPDNVFESSDHYWECVLSYLYGENPGSIYETIKATGKWITWLNCTTDSKDKKSSYFTLQKSYLKPEYWEEYDKAVIEYEEYIKNLKDAEDNDTEGI